MLAIISFFVYTYKMTRAERKELISKIKKLLIGYPDKCPEKIKIQKQIKILEEKK